MRVAGRLGCAAWIGCALTAAAGTALADAALEFDGVDDRVTVAYDSSFPTEVFTIAAWLKTALPARNSAILARGEDDTSFNLSWQLYVTPSGELRVMLEDANENNACYPLACDGSPQPACTSTDLYVADDLWHHVSATRDAAGSLALYIDGQTVTNCQNTALPSSANRQALTIGCTHGSIGPPPGGVEPPIWFFSGTIDEAAMWDAALSQLAVEAVYTSGVDPADAGLVGYWGFEGTGQLVADGSAAGNDGTLGANSSAESADPVRVNLPEPTSELGLATALLTLAASARRRTRAANSPRRSLVSRVPAR
jgi:hypothetical protein